LDEPGHGDFFGFASMMDDTPHRTNAMAMEETYCIEVDRNDIAALLERKPLAGMDMLAVLGRQQHAIQQLVRLRAGQNANDLIDEESTFGERIADSVARFGGSWTFIITFGVVLTAYTAMNVILRASMGPVSVHPAEPLPLDVGLHSGTGHHDEPEPQDTKDRHGASSTMTSTAGRSRRSALSSKLNLLTDKLGDVDDLFAGAAQPPLISYQAVVKHSWFTTVFGNMGQSGHLSFGVDWIWLKAAHRNIAIP